MHGRMPRPSSITVLTDCSAEYPDTNALPNAQIKDDSHNTLWHCFCHEVPAIVNSMPHCWAITPPVTVYGIIITLLTRSFVKYGPVGGDGCWGCHQSSGRTFGEHRPYGAPPKTLSGLWRRRTSPTIKDLELLSQARVFATADLEKAQRSGISPLLILDRVTSRTAVDYTLLYLIFVSFGHYCHPFHEQTRPRRPTVRALAHALRGQHQADGLVMLVLLYASKSASFRISYLKTKSAPGGWGESSVKVRLGF